MIDTTGIDNADVLAALYNNSRAFGLGALHFDPTPMSKQEAEKLLKERTYFDYHKGRLMKVDIEGDKLDPYGYDRDLGDGAAQRAINSIK